MATNDSVLAPLERWTPALFLASGGILVIFAVNTGLMTYTGTSYPIVGEVIGPVGFLLSVVGLIGLYPALADQVPTLARAAVAVTLIAAVCWILIIVGGIGETAGVLPQGGVLPTAIRIVVLVTMILGFILFGVSSLRTDGHPMSVGVLLLVLPTMLLSLLTGVIPPVVIDTVNVLALLGIGSILLTKGSPENRTGPAADSTA